MITATAADSNDEMLEILEAACDFCQEAKICWEDRDA